MYWVQLDKSESAIGNIAFAIRLSSFQDSFPWIQQRVVKVQSGLTLTNCQMEKLLAKPAKGRLTTWRCWRRSLNSSTMVWRFWKRRRRRTDLFLSTFEYVCCSKCQLPSSSGCNVLINKVNNHYLHLFPCFEMAYFFTWCIFKSCLKWLALFAE